MGPEAGDTRTIDMPEQTNRRWSPSRPTGRAWAPARWDVVVAAVVAVIGGLATGAMSASFGVGVPAVTGAMVAAEGVPLAWRRRAPIAVLVASTLIAWSVAALPAAAFTPLIAAVVAAYTVATERRVRVAAAAAALAGGGSAVVIQGLLGTGFPYSISVVLADHLANALAGAVLAFGGATVLGASVRTHRAHTAGVEERAARLERERIERERRAVLEERARIARELHDVAAHHLSGLVLQAGALERTARHDPEQARQLAADVRQGGATALASMRRLVGLLRSDDDDAGTRGSQPTLDDLGGLVEAARGDGLDVALDTATADGPVPDEVGLAAFRIVQEALSNTRRHAPGAQATVRVGRTEHRLEVEVVDEGGHGPPLPDAGDEPGHGLIGMRERVALLDGEFEAGPRRPSGWQVRAEIPLDGQEAT